VFVFVICEAALEEDLNKDVNGKSLKMPRGEEARGYLEYGALKPPKKILCVPSAGTTGSTSHRATWRRWVVIPGEARY